MTSTRGILGLVVVVAVVSAFAIMVVAGWDSLRDPGLLVREVAVRLDSPARPGDDSRLTFVVRRGETATEISDRLQAEGLVRDARVFRWMAEIRGVAGELAAGEYELSPGMRSSDILAVLAEARTKSAPLLTIPEGWRAEEIADRLAARGIGTPAQFLAVVRQGRSTAGALSSRPPGASLEGYLFPDSYSVDSRSTPENIAERMVQQFDLRFTQEMRDRAAALGMTVHQVVTLASVIEREAVVPSERPLMAGVFYNRLREGVPLQSDPTVQYALTVTAPESQQQYGWWKTVLTAEDLEIDSPYNTYRYPGLPPGPICNPGLASLRAALEPETTDYLYFVARPDGSHAFARTLEEHNANVAVYRR